MSPDLSAYDNSWYCPGRGPLVRGIWFFLGLPILRSNLNPLSSSRRILLKIFGAKIGHNVAIKPGVQVKYPWHLTIGSNSWIGENVWIDNLCPVTIGSNSCLSQGAYLCTGNHDWSDPGFGLIVKPITVGNGAWLGAKCVISPGIEIGESAIAAAGSVVTKDIPAFEIHAGNPAHFIRHRVFRGTDAQRTLARPTTAQSHPSFPATTAPNRAATVKERQRTGPI